MVPTLLIGLGGFGSKVVADVYQAFQAGNPTPADQDRFACYCINFDRYEINELRRRIPQDCIGDLSVSLQLPLPESVRRLSDSTAVLDWFDMDERIVPVMGHAGRQSPVSRMDARVQMLAESEGVFHVISDKIASLAHLGQWPIEVHIVCSLAGHTGSGILLQTACLVKEALGSINVPGDISGHFLMGEAFAHLGLGCNYDYCLTNTYACLKEFNALDKQHETLPFEYRIGQPGPGVPAWPLFDRCYLSGHRGGGHSIKDHRDSMGCFILYAVTTNLNAQLVPMNQIRGGLAGLRNYSEFAVSKLVYPVDDLFAYFSSQRTADVLHAWHRFDEEYKKEFASYRDDLLQGIPHPRPSVSASFMNRLESLAQEGIREGDGYEEILRSTRLYDDNGNLVHSKARQYVLDVQAEVHDRILAHLERNETTKSCQEINPAFTDTDVFDEDIRTVMQTEKALNAFWRTALAFCDHSGRPIAHECFLADQEEEGFVSKVPCRLNSIILKKGEEMHPLAVRYFLYDLKDNHLQPILNEKKEANEHLRQEIEDYFKEDEAEQLESVWDENHTLAKRFVQLFTGRKPYREWKRQYAADSSAQAGRIRKYLEDKAVEESFSHLLSFVNRILEEVESFFGHLPEVLETIEKDVNAQLSKHEMFHCPNVSYALASAQIKKGIFDDGVRVQDLPFFSHTLSASLYRDMYQSAVKDITWSKITSRPDCRWISFETCPKVIQQCVDEQARIIREHNPEYAQKNVIDALREEASQETGFNPAEVFPYMVRKSEVVRQEAHIYDLPQQAHQINAWGMHPSCAQALTQQEMDVLFPVTTDIRHLSPSFKRNEVVRVETAHLLALTDFDRLSKDGPYHAAYRAAERNPHLDRHWFNDLPDIDES